MEKNEFENKFLVLLCLKSKLDYFKLKIYSQFQAKGIAINNEAELISYLNNNGITPIFIIWEDIMELFKSNNLLTQSMEFFINNRFINLIAMHKEDLEMLNSKMIPNLLFSLWNTVDQVKGILLKEKFSVGRTGQSRSFYGYTIYFDWGSLWFGHYIDSWNIMDTPFVIQLRENWIENEVVRSNAPKFLKSIEFKENSDFGYLYLYKPRHHLTVPCFQTTLLNIS